MPHQVRRVYDTPHWVAPTRADELGATSLRLLDGEPAEEPTWPAELTRRARWTSTRAPYLAAAFLLVGFLAAALAAGTGLLGRQSTPMLALALGCLLGAAGVYALLVVLRPVVVELAAPWLAVRKGVREDRFDLSAPFQALQVHGRPGSRRWRLTLHCPDGRVVRVTRTMADSRRLDPVVAHAQGLAARARAAREERFNR